jgi:Uma2 family endonuclease
MLSPSADKDKRYTYEDYAAWDDGNRYELINGIPHAMAAPSRDHQRVLGEIFRQFSNFLLNRSCEAFVAPFDVCLNGLRDEDKTIVQPDIFVVCDKSKLNNNKYCNGAPDLVIEIVSPSSKQRDWITKLNIYKQAGVREYWIVDPRYRQIDVFLLKEDWSVDEIDKVAKTYSENDTVPVEILSEYKFEIKLESVFK